MPFALRGQDVGDQAWGAGPAGAPVSVCSGGSWGGRGREWVRNKCYLFDEASFALGLVLPAASGILTLAGAPAQSWLAHQQPETDHFPALCLSFPVCQGRGSTPCSGLKGFSVAPRVIIYVQVVDQLRRRFGNGAMKVLHAGGVSALFTMASPAQYAEAAQAGEQTAAQQSSPGSWSQLAQALRLFLLCDPGHVAQPLRASLSARMNPTCRSRGFPSLIHSVIFSGTWLTM